MHPFADRGAELSFLSQYPFEKEVLFAPLTGLEAQFTRAEGKIIMVETRLSVNLMSRTIEHVIGNMKDAYYQIIESCESRIDNRDHSASKALLRLNARNENAEWFNEPNNFSLAVQGAVKLLNLFTKDDTEGGQDDRWYDRRIGAEFIAPSRHVQRSEWSMDRWLQQLKVHEIIGTILTGAAKERVSAAEPEEHAEGKYVTALLELQGDVKRSGFEPTDAIRLPQVGARYDRWVKLDPLLAAGHGEAPRGW